MALSESIARPAGRTRPSRRYRLLAGGTGGNEQLTAVAGVILLVLFAALGITIIRIGQLLWWHLFLGVLLVGPVALKLGSTSYRFTRYYAANTAYRRKGPPDRLMRVLGPFVVLTTVTVFLTGLLLLVDGPYASGTLRQLHKVTFFMWLVAVGLHVLGHLVELPGSLKAVSRDEHRTRRLPGSSGRALAVAGSLIAGLVLALLFLPDVHSWTAVGLHHFHHFGEH
jgi:hypothetical protein